MGRRKESIAYLDTHIIVWLYAGLKEKITKNAKEKIENCELQISHFSRLELQYLHEIGRIKTKPAIIVKSLAKSINLKAADCPLNEIIDEALKINWTRDVFDRLLVAETKASGCLLITADKDIRKNFKHSIW
jgi:PIN domain nuclease of toxin-antitoxin system